MIPVLSLPLSDPLYKYSDPVTAQQRAFQRFGATGILYKSTDKKKKYTIMNNNKRVNFGQLGYEDFLKHKDVNRQSNYLARTDKIKGNWRTNPYSPNNLSRNILW